MHIVLIGMMGCGKSAVGRKLARKLAWKFKDVDDWIEKEQKTSIAKIFETKGEPFFRDLEKKMIARLAVDDQSVIAAGGGAPCFEENWKRFTKHGFVVWLKAQPKKLLERVMKSPHGKRPLLKDRMTQERISELLKQREPFYSRAHLTIETDDLNTDQVMERIMEMLDSPAKNYWRGNDNL